MPWHVRCAQCKLIIFIKSFKRRWSSFQLIIITCLELTWTSVFPNIHNTANCSHTEYGFELGKTKRQRPIMEFGTSLRSTHNSILVIPRQYIDSAAQHVWPRTIIEPPTIHTKTSFNPISIIPFIWVVAERLLSVLCRHRNTDTSFLINVIWIRVGFSLARKLNGRRLWGIVVFCFIAIKEPASGGG